MSAKLEAAKNIQFLSRMMAGLIALGPELERVGSLEEAEAALKRSIEGLKTTEAEWLDKIERHKAEFSRSHESAVLELAKIESVAKKTMADADEYHAAQVKLGNDRLEDAGKKALALLDQAKTDGQAMIDHASSEVRRAKDEQAEAERARDVAKADREQHESAVEALRRQIGAR